jgi:hypothetical protein
MIKENIKWSEDELDFVKANHKILTNEEIAAKLGRKRNSVQAKVTRLIKSGELEPFELNLWTKEEEDYLKDNYYETPFKEIVAYLKRSKQAIYVHAWHMGLEKLIGYTEKEEKLITSLYEEGYSCVEIVKKAGFSSEDTVKRFLRREGLIRSLSDVSEMKADHLKGQKFGKLTLVNRIVKEVKNGGLVSFWECECECGGRKTARTNSLTGGHTTNCGCDKTQGWGEITGNDFWRIGFGARNRNIEFDISAEYIWGLFLSQNRKCALSGYDICFGKGVEKTASLDRIDSTKGYIEGNVQWLHKTINILKLDYGQDEFISYCRAVAKNCEDRVLFLDLSK